MKREKSIFGKRIFVICFMVALVLIVFLLGNLPAVSEYVFARGITRFFSLILNFVTNAIPISFYEWTVLLLIVGSVALIAGFIVILCKKEFRRARTWLYRVGVALLSVALAFGILYAPLYHRASVTEALGLKEQSVTDELVYQAAEFYITRLNAVSARFERDESGNILPVLTFSELSDTLNDAFDSLDCDYFASYRVQPKQVVLSVPMSYLGITGIYFPFFAESNINMNIPAYELPFTMAHEMAHAKGVAQENEANIVSYVLCIRSDSAYLNYSGLIRASVSLLNALPQEEYTQLLELIAPEIRKELANGSAHYAKYDGLLDGISSFFNDLFLKSNGVSGGIKSYSETMQCLVSLYEILSLEGDT